MPRRPRPALNLQRDLLTGGVPKQSRSAKAAEEFDFQLRSHRFSGWIREHQFAKDFPGRWPKDWDSVADGKARAWRFDFAQPQLLLAVEVEGLRVQQLYERVDHPGGGASYRKKTVCTGRHSTVDGYREDCRKYAAAIEIGWHVLRFTQDQVLSGEAIATVERVLAARGAVNRSAPAQTAGALHA